MSDETLRKSATADVNAVYKWRQTHTKNVCVLSYCSNRLISSSVKGVDPFRSAISSAVRLLELPMAVSPRSAD